MVRTAPSQQNLDALKKGMAQANSGFKLLDDRLNGRPFLAGDTLTYADILCGVSLYRWATLDVKRIDMPHVHAWHARLKLRPAFVTGVEVDFSGMYVKD
jgi:glutathione S-transferase